MKTSYINSHDLLECLRDYFNGSLDSIPLMDRITRPLQELHPSNSLWGQLLTSDVYKALDSISPLHMSCIAQEFAPGEAYEEYITTMYIHSGTNLPKWEWQSQQFAEAILQLAEVIKSKL